MAEKIDFKKFTYACFGAAVIVVVLLILKIIFPDIVINVPPAENYTKSVSINWDILRKPLSVSLPALDIDLISSPQATTSGAYVSLTAEVKGASQGPFIYHFDCQNDGIFELETDAVFQKIYTAQNICFFDKEGVFTPNVVVDGFFDYFQDGQEIKEKRTAQAISKVEVSDSNLPPVFLGCDVDSVEGTTQVNFKFNFTSKAQDPNGDGIKYEWDFGDGNKAEGQNVEYSYKTMGFFVPKVKAIDPKGAFAYCVAKSLTILRGLSSFETISTSRMLKGRQDPFSIVKPEDLVLDTIKNTTPIITPLENSGQNQATTTSQ
ncbi:MAG: PKD domain-containing protein [Candidatus Pacebacteria bacterium]|nr:PKD domain-containing protein [Candidatus Paceibacterota bacterium]